MPRTAKDPLPPSRASLKRKASTRHRPVPSTASTSKTSANKTSANKKQKSKVDNPLEKRPIPIELLGNIFSFLDATANRQLLVGLTTVSRAFFDAAVPILYGHLAITETQLRRLVVNGQAKKHQKHSFRHLRKLRSQGVSRLSPSSQRALQHIVRLELLSRPSNATIEALWASTIPNMPLFPNVRWLRIDHSVRVGELAKDRPRYPTYPLDDEVILFDTPNVCCRGDMNLLDYLPTLNARSLTTHTDHCNYTLSKIPQSPINARPFRVFLLAGRRRGCYGNPELWAGNLREHQRPEPRPTFYVNMPSSTFYETALARFQWRPNDKTDQLAFIEGVEPCVVCGKTWDDEEIGSGTL